MSFKCPNCDSTFTNTVNLSRHKHHSCSMNPNKTPRSDNKTKKNIDISSVHSNSDASQNTNMTSVPVQGNNTLKITNSDITTVQAQNTIQPESGNSNISNAEIKQIFDFMKGINQRMDKLTNPNDKPDKSKLNVFNIDKIQIYLTDPVDFVEVLTKRMGSRKQAIDYIRSQVHKKVEGDVDLFCEIYLNGPPDTWPIRCPDKKNRVFRIAKPDSSVINDPGGVQIYKMFKNEYSNTLLRLTNSMIFETLKQIPGTDEFETSRDILLDSFELGVIQNKAHDLCKASCDPFIKKLSVKFNSLEKSYELASEGL